MDDENNNTTLSATDAELLSYIQMAMEGKGKRAIGQDIKQIVAKFPEYLFSWNRLGLLFEKKLQPVFAFDQLNKQQRQWIALHDIIVEALKEGTSVEKLYASVSTLFKDPDDLISNLAKCKQVVSIKEENDTLYVNKNLVVVNAIIDIRQALQHPKKNGVSSISHNLIQKFPSQAAALDFVTKFLPEYGPYILDGSKIIAKKQQKPNPPTNIKELPIIVSTKEVVEDLVMEQEAKDAIGDSFVLLFTNKTQLLIRKIEQQLAQLTSIRERTLEDKKLAYNFVSISKRLELLQQYLTRQSKDIRELTMNDVKEEMAKLLEQKTSMEQQLTLFQYQLSEKEELLQALQQKITEEKKAAELKEPTPAVEQTKSTSTRTLTKLDVNSTPQQVIEAIRKEKGFDTEVTPEVRLCFQNLYTTLKHAINKLAVDIYSSGNRFALELIQNADDNKYTDNTEPYFHMKITSSYVLVHNNEIGFAPENIRALCDVGGSTKKGSEFIGHKGVGFKSVFQVTDTPHIFSRGFQFKFDVKQELGYIVPHWVDQSACPEKLDESLTSLYLPLKPGIELNTKELFDGFDLVLLFLHKLKRLTIAWEDKSKTIAVNDNPANIRQVDVTATNALPVSYQYYVYSQELMVPTEFLQDFAKGTKTEISLAFPIDSKQIQLIYAYLPVSSVGFHFILQADFDLTTSRQEVHKNKKWNIWLRDQFVNLFFQAYKENDDIKKNIINYLPSASEVSDPFWLQLVDGIQKMLADEICLETESGSWLPTKQVLVRYKNYVINLQSRSQHLHDLISNKELKASLGLEFCASTISRQEALYKFHCQEFSVDHMMRLLTSSDFPLNEKLLEWFYNLHEYLLKNLHDLKNHLELLPTLNMFKLSETHEPTSLSQGKIFRTIPVDYDLGNVSVIRVLPASPAHLHKLYDVLGVTAASVMEVADAIVKLHLQQRLDMPEEGLDWEISAQVVLNQLRFIRDNLSEISKVYSVEQLQGTLCIPSSKGKYYAPDAIYYKPEVVELFAEVGIEVPHMYGYLSWEGSERTAWENFLMTVGCHAAPRVISSPLGNELAPQTSALLDTIFNKKDTQLTDKLFAVMDKVWSLYQSKQQTDVILPLLKKMPLNTTLSKTVIPINGDVSFVHAPIFSKDFGSDIPLLLSPIKNPDLLSALRCFQDMSLEAAKAILQFLPKSPEALEKYNIIYRIFEEKDWLPPTIYISSCNDLVKTTKLIWDGDEEVCKFLKMYRLKDDYQDLQSYFAQVNKTFTIGHLKMALINVLKASQSEPNNRLRGLCIKNHAVLLEKIYTGMEVMLKELNNQVTANSIEGILVLNDNWSLIGYGNIASKLVACDDPELEETIFKENQYFKFAPVNKMLLQCPILLQHLNIPKLSTLVSSQLSLYRAPTMDKRLTEKYRACIRHTLQLSSKVLLPTEKQKLNYLFDHLRVYTTEKVYVRFTVHDHEFVRRQPFFVDDQQCLLVVEDGSSVNIKVLLKLLPAASNEAINLEYLFTESSIQAWIKEHPIIIHSQPAPQWNLCTPRFGTSPNPSPAKPSQTSNRGAPPFNSSTPPSSSPLGTPIKEGIKPSLAPNKEDFPAVAAVIPGHSSQDSVEQRTISDDNNQPNNTNYEQSLMEDISQILEDYRYTIHHQPEELFNSLTKFESKTVDKEHPHTTNKSSIAFQLVQVENKDALLIGQIAEAFMWTKLSKVLPHISPSCWVSSNRTVLFPNDAIQANDSVGFDFQFTGNNMLYRIEVKGHLADFAAGFHFSENERRTAMESHHAPNMKYIIVGICVTPHPRIIYTLVDPIQLESKNQLKMTPSQYLVSDFERFNDLDKILEQAQKVEPAEFKIPDTFKRKWIDSAKQQQQSSPPKSPQTQPTAPKKTKWYPQKQTKSSTK